MRQSRILFYLLLIAGLLISFPALSQQELNYNPDVTDPDIRPITGEGSGAIDPKLAIGPFNGPVPPISPAANFQQTWICRAFGPAEVTGFRVQCTNATFLDVHVADCCIPGDHWQAKSKNWSRFPNYAVTTAPGPANVYGVPGRTYNYGGTPFNPGNIDTYVECTPRSDDVDVFPADGFYSFSSDGPCTITPDAPRQRIDRSP